MNQGNKMIILTGPTAVEKTALSIELAKKVKTIMLKDSYDKDKTKVWKSLFDKFCK